MAARAAGIATDGDACPFTPLNRDCLGQHETVLRKNPRMAMQMKNLDRLDANARAAIASQADAHRAAQA